MADYRRRYRRGPVGVWLASHERLTLYGTQFEFRNDSTGTIISWGYDEDGDEEGQHEFHWKSVGDFAVDIQPVEAAQCEDDWGLIEYDFRAVRSPYGHRVVEMYSKDGATYDGRAPGFWWEAHGVELVKNP